MKANIHQISELTGFSPATISKALNGKKGIREETVKIIREAADQLGYRTETKISKIYLVILEHSKKTAPSTTFHHFVLDGVEKQAQEAELETVLVLLDKQSPSFLDKISELTNDLSAAIVLVGTGLVKEDYDLFLSCKNRIIVMDGWSKFHPFASVLIDNEDLAETAVNYLLEKGHRKIGYLRSQRRLNNFSEREDGYYKALRKAGLPINPAFIIDVGVGMEATCSHVRQALSKASDLPTAFLAENDYIAIGASRGIQQAGFRIPEDISLIGIDDIEYAKMETPPLTTFQVHMQDIGRLAVQELLKESNKALPKIKIQVCADLIERQSVKNLSERGCCKSR